jgi:hypothetical protein
MHLNKLRDIKRIKGENFKFSRIGQVNDDSSDDEESKKNSQDEVHAFEIDSELPNGRVAIMYRGGHQKP